MANRYQSDDPTRRYGRGYGRQEEQFESNYGPPEGRTFGQMGDRSTADYYREDDSSSWAVSDRFGPSRGRAGGNDDSHGYSRFSGEPRRNYDRYAGSDFQNRERARSDRGADRASDPFASGAGSLLAAGHGEWHDPNEYGARGYGREHTNRGRDDNRGFFEKASDEIQSWFEGDTRSGSRERGYRGHGPANYTRSDERIRDDVNDRLTDDYRVDARNINVTVDNGEVTLNGTVTSRDQKRRAEDVVEDLSGVKHVQNNLRVADQPNNGGTYDPTAGKSPTGTI